MEANILLSLRLWISSFKLSNRIMTRYSDDIIIHFFDLLGNSSGLLMEEIRQNLAGVSKENFVKQFDIKRLEASKQHKVNALHSIFMELPMKTSFFMHSDQVIEKCGSILYESYIFRTRLLRDKEVEIIDFSESDLRGVLGKLNLVAKEVIRIESLKSITGDLEFSDIFNPQKKIIINKVADACLIEMTANVSISVEQLIEILHKKYIFSYYGAETDQKYRKRKIEKATRSRYRYMKNKWEK